MENVAQTEALVPQRAGGQLTPASDILAVIAAAAADDRVNPEKLSALLGLKERIDAKEAEAAFNRDFSLASAEMPRVSKHGTIRLVKDGVDKGSLPFARYEDIDTVLRPIEVRFGFCRSFTTAPAEQPGILMTVRLSHRDGHSITSTRFMPPDPGPGRNAMQAIGSASSYAKRYLTLDIWNIICEGQDDDGNATGFINQQQVDNITDMISECHLDRNGIAALLKFANAGSVGQIQQRNYERVMEALKAKLKKIREGGK